MFLAKNKGSGLYSQEIRCKAKEKRKNPIFLANLHSSYPPSPCNSFKTDHENQE